MTFICYHVRSGMESNFAVRTSDITGNAYVAVSLDSSGDQLSIFADLPQIEQLADTFRAAAEALGAELDAQTEAGVA